MRNLEKDAKGNFAIWNKETGKQHFVRGSDLTEYLNWPDTWTTDKSEIKPKEKEEKPLKTKNKNKK